MCAVYLFLSTRFVTGSLQVVIIVPVSQPAVVAHRGGFDYVTVDPARRRIYAAHTGAGRLVISDADTGNVLGQVEVGPMHGSAADPVTGDVYTADGRAHAVSEVDPRTMKVIARTPVPGPVDALAYDPFFHRIYADEDSGTVIYVIDARTMKMTGGIALPGHDEEYVVVDPRSDVVYQNVPDLREFVEIDPTTLRVTKTVKTPMLISDHPLQYDYAYHEIVVGGKNGVMAAYTRGGTLLGSTTFPAGVDQCSLDQRNHELACAGKGVLSVLRVNPHGAPKLLATLRTGHDLHTVAIDPKTGYLWTVWPGKTRSYEQRFEVK